MITTSIRSRELKSIYSILDNSARAWWYHAELRQQGKAAEARKRERESIRRRVKTLRETKKEGGFAIALKGRHLLFVSQNSYESGYSPSETIALCKFLDIPVLDLSRREYLPAGMPTGFKEGREWVLDLKRRWHR